MISNYRRYLFSGISALYLGITISIIQEILSKQINRILPGNDNISLFNRPNTLVILSADEQILQKTGPIIREKVESSQIPILLAKAFIAAEDRRFYYHNGVDLYGIGRALITDFISHSTKQGASTITQQLARMVFLDQKHTLIRKVKELMLSYRLEDELTKEQILTHYMNNIYLGSGAYGVTDASWVYFSKTPNQLSLSEIAIIAGLPPAPTKYSPMVSNKLAQERKSLVLMKMRQAGFITYSQEYEARASAIEVKPAPPKFFPSQAPHFTNWLIEELSTTYNSLNYQSQSLTIWSSLNLKWQKEAEKAIRKNTRNQLEGALVSIEPGTGLVRTMVGGRNSSQSKLNRTYQSFRSPGSTFKIFIYAAAMMQGVRTYDLVLDTSRCFGEYCPKNFNSQYKGYIPFGMAFRNSLNTVAILLFHEIGFDRIMATIRRFGLTIPLTKVYPVALGACEQTILGMTSAYAAIISGGVYNKPYPFEEIYNTKSQKIWEYNQNSNEKDRVLTPSVANDMLAILQSVVNDGTGKWAVLPNRSVAGKTGTSEGARDLWFIGSIPQLTTGVWFGRDNSSETNDSSSIAALTWKEFMEQVTKDIPIEYFSLYSKIKKSGDYDEKSDVNKLVFTRMKEYSN